MLLSLPHDILSDIVSRLRAEDKVRLSCACKSLRVVHGSCEPMLRETKMPEQYLIWNQLDDTIVERFGCMVRRLSRLERKLRKGRASFGKYVSSLNQLMCLDSERLSLAIRGDIVVNQVSVDRIPIHMLPCEEAMERSRTSIRLILCIGSRCLTIEWKMAWHGWHECSLVMSHMMYGVNLELRCLSSILVHSRTCSMAIGLAALTSGNQLLDSSNKESIVTLHTCHTRDALLCAPMEIWATQRMLGLLSKGRKASKTVVPTMLVCWMGSPNAFLRETIRMIPRVFFYDAPRVWFQG